MAKKQSRAKRRSRQVRLSAAQLAQPGLEDTESAVPGARLPEAADLRDEYGYVAGDLRRALILGALVLAVLAASLLLLS